MYAALQGRRFFIILLAVLMHLILGALLFISLIFDAQKSKHPPFMPVADELKKEWAARHNPAPVIFYQEPKEAAIQEQAPTIAHEQQHEPVDQAQEMTEDDIPQKPVAQPLQETIVPKLPELQEKPVEKAVEKPRRRPQKKAAPQPAKRQLKLADLTNMFMDRMDKVPMGQMFMQGAADKLPQDKQIIFERYRQKVGAIIAQVHREYPLPFNNIPDGTAVQLYLALNSTGRFKDIHITSSSGIQAVDDYCMFVYQKASEQFPPIPESLEESLFKGMIRLYAYKQTATNKQDTNWFLFQ